MSEWETLMVKRHCKSPNGGHAWHRIPAWQVGESDVVSYGVPLHVDRVQDHEPDGNIYLSVWSKGSGKFTLILAAEYELGVCRAQRAVA